MQRALLRALQDCLAMQQARQYQVPVQPSITTLASRFSS